MCSHLNIFYNYFHAPHGHSSVAPLHHHYHPPIYWVTFPQLIPAGWFDKSAQEQSSEAKWSHEKSCFFLISFQLGIHSWPLVIQSREKKWRSVGGADPSGIIHFHINELANARLIFEIHYWPKDEDEQRPLFFFRLFFYFKADKILFGVSFTQDAECRRPISNNKLV